MQKRELCKLKRGPYIQRMRKNREHLLPVPPSVPTSMSIRLGFAELKELTAETKL